jgi:hypothetical protein
VQENRDIGMGGIRLMNLPHVEDHGFHCTGTAALPRFKVREQVRGHSCSRLCERGPFAC